jgi:iron complex transport system ATP-binding protein
MILVEARDLALRGRLRSTSLTLTSGTLTCVIGPNGGGKTSLLHALAGIGAPEGTVRIDGSDPRAAGTRQRKALISYLPTSRDIRWPLTGMDVVALGLQAGARRHLADPLLAELELTGLADRRMDRLSTGERARFLIARALVAKPRLLLLDEPAANLDPLWQLRVMELVRREARSNGRAALVAVHDLDHAARYGDRLLIVQGGKIVADGEPHPLLQGPLTPRVFGVARESGEWRVVRPAGPRSSL